MTPPFSFPVRFEAQPPPTGSVRAGLSSLALPGSSRFNDLNGYFRPGHAVGRSGSRNSTRSPQAPPQSQDQGGLKTFRITRGRAPIEPWAAASFNPGM
ncbi:MAG TPA: hypothetical protein VF518_05455 [Polyangia bacterium]